MKAYLACDPGAKGFICLLVPDENHIEFVCNSEKPIEITKWLAHCKDHYDLRIAMIEDVHSIFGMSAKSNFSFGYNTGIITGIIQSQGIGLDKVAPKKWQKAVGVKAKGKAIKEEVASIAERLYPQAEIRGAKGGLQDGKSDSLMIAHYAYLTYK